MNMPAPLTVERIHEVANQLAEAGQRPTLAAVREALGGGSFTTISEAMKKWHKQASEQAQQPVVESLPEALQQPMLAATAALWKEAQTLAVGRLDHERQALQQARESMEVEQAETVELAEQMERDLERARQSLEGMEQRIEEQAQLLEQQRWEFRQELGEAQAKHDELRTKAAEAEARYQESERRAEDLRAELDRAHQEGERARSALAEQKTTTDKYFDELNKTREELAASKAQVRTLETGLEEAGRVKADALAERDAARSELATTTAQVMGLREDVARLEGASEAEQRAYQDLLARFEAMAKADKETPKKQEKAATK